MSNTQTVAELQAELDSVISWFESDEVDIDLAIEKFKQGQALILELKTRLQQAELQIKKIQSK